MRLIDADALREVLASLEEATKLADKLGNDWYAVEWRTVK